MTIQQMEYIVAVNKYRHFVTASEKCGVTQPTLSMMIQKLEEELEIKIFDRTKHPIEPTNMGLRIIRQAEASLFEIRKIKEMVIAETESLSGNLQIGIIPTVAPYLVPEFITFFQLEYPTVDLSISEMRTNNLIQHLHEGLVDIIIASTPLNQPDFYEIPLYYEQFVAYFASDNQQKDHFLTAENLPGENLWVLQEGHCIRNQIFNLCSQTASYNHVYEAGSIDTLIRIVDKNGGYTLIPELHLPFLTEEQKKNVRSITSPPAVREISIIIRKDYVKERMINAVADTVKKIIPSSMLDERLKKFSIKL